MNLRLRSKLRTRRSTKKRKQGWRFLIKKMPKLKVRELRILLLSMKKLMRIKMISMRVRLKRNWISLKKKNNFFSNNKNL